MKLSHRAEKKLSMVLKINLQIIKIKLTKLTQGSNVKIKDPSGEIDDFLRVYTLVLI